MQILIFCHSLLSDWNHGNAHFLRGIATELVVRGHDVRVYEPEDAWSIQNLLQNHGEEPIAGFRAAYPAIHAERYRLSELKLEDLLRSADMVLVHEWNDPELVRSIGEHHAAHGGYRLFFHDTHHRSVTAPAEMARYDLTQYDGVLAFGRVIRDLYLQNGWTKRAWTWHEAADTRVFHPQPLRGRDGDLVWIGNWGDDERTEELREFLLEPVKALGLKARVYGVRYPPEALEALDEAGIEYGGWLPNFRVPEIFARYRVTVHVPRRPYVEALPGVPTIRVFEALACAIPLISAPWNDAEHLFDNGEDFVIAQNGREMRDQLAAAVERPQTVTSTARCGFEAVRGRHTCAHRVDELLEIYRSLET